MRVHAKEMKDKYQSYLRIHEKEMKEMNTQQTSIKDEKNNKVEVSGNWDTKNLLLNNQPITNNCDILLKQNQDWNER